MYVCETKLGRISLGDIIVFKTETGDTGLGWIESLKPSGESEKEIKIIKYIPKEDGVSLGEISQFHMNIGDFENRITKMGVVGRLTTREEWNRFVETCKHIIILNCIKKEGFAVQ